MANFLAEEIVAIVSRLRTSKTFYFALLAIAAAFHGWLGGNLSGHQALALGLGSLIAIGMRDGIAKTGGFPESLAVDIEMFMRMVAHAPPSPAVAAVLAKRGIPVTEFQAIFRDALAISYDLAPVPLPVVEPPPAAPTA